ncbi:MAG: DUF308 domain-containing protein [Micropruina sp.]|uniref:HdeD family acid-resistance protein n=1 Tax=Micropruina sp. TaxID=2737536 RepID=UPI0039E37ED4
MLDLLKRSSTYLLISGSMALVFGIVAAFFPFATAATVVVLWGVYALVDGVAAATMAARPGPGQSRGYLILTAIVGIVAGLVAVISPVSVGAALAWVLGAWLIVRGVLEIASAFAQRLSGSRWLLLLGGLFWLAAGALIVSYPGVAVLSVALWLGVMAIVWGIALLVVGVAVRRAAADAAPIRGQIVPPRNLPPA